jgi:arylsulfatase A-like enzyme
LHARSAWVLAVVLALGPACSESDSGSGASVSGGDGDPGVVEASSGGEPERLAVPVQAGLAENVLLISLDTLRSDRLQPYGYRRPTSPNLAAIADRGVLFEQARAQAPQTAPSHASLFTSSYPGVHRVINVHGPTPQMFELPAGLTTMAELLSGNGFQTGGFVSGGNLTRRMGMDRGFDVWDEQLTDIEDRIDRCLEWMLAPDRGRFFAFLHSYQVHAPYLPPQEFYEEFCDPAYTGRLRDRTDRYLAMPAKQAWEAAAGPVYWEGMLEYDEQDVRFLSDLYDAEVRYVDSQVRRLWEVMASGGLLQNTIVIFLSDHGEEFMDHGKYQHDQVFDELLHVPLIVRFPAQLENAGFKGRVGELVELVDVAPTVAELLGVSAANVEWSGRSLVELMKSVADKPHVAFSSSERPSFSELHIDPGPKIHRTVTWRGWKYIHIWQVDIDHTWEYLFNTAKDPREKRNLMSSSDADTQRILDALQKRLEDQTVRNREAALRVGPGGSLEVDADMLEMMRKLGYVGPEDR